MKKLALMMALCVLFAGCAEQHVSPESAEAPPSVTASPSPGVETSPSPEPLSYEEYFSEYREFRTQYDEDFFNYESVFIAGGIGYADNDELQTNALYWLREATNIFQLVAEDVDLFQIVKDRFYIVQGNAIYNTDANGGDRKLVLEASADITDLVANDTLVFYIADEKLYRYYQPDGITDFLGDTPEIMSFYPQSNCEVIWNIFNPEASTDSTVQETSTIPSIINFYINSTTAENRLITVDETFEKFGH